LCFTGLANYNCRFVEGYTEVAALLTALGSPTEQFLWTQKEQASFDTLKQDLSLVLALCTFDQGRWTTYSIGVTVAAAILSLIPDSARR
jgi:hypothetical protein